MAGGEVSLGVPVRLAGLHLVSGELVAVINLHCAVNDPLTRYTLQVTNLQHHNLPIYIFRLSLVELRHYCALIGRELQSVEIFS